jgi:hypothetical protein
MLEFLSGKRPSGTRIDGSQSPGAACRGLSSYLPFEEGLCTDPRFGARREESWVYETLLGWVQIVRDFHRIEQHRIQSRVGGVAVVVLTDVG